MFQSSISIPQPSATYAPYGSDALDQETGLCPNSRIEASVGMFAGLMRRVRRERRRRSVGRAYDMALEVARVIPRHSCVLDVGCGNGFIAHHLSSLIGTKVIGMDLNDNSQAQIDYKKFDGTTFPITDQSVDVILLCYVLHHAQDVDIVMREMRRVLREGGLAIVYEDIPALLWDRFVCWTHNLKWRRRTGACTFRLEDEWRQLFGDAGFQLIRHRQLSRWRNLAHPVSRGFFLLRRHASLEE